MYDYLRECWRKGYKTPKILENAPKGMFIDESHMLEQFKEMFHDELSNM